LANKYLFIFTAVSPEEFKWNILNESFVEFYAKLNDLVSSNFKIGEKISDNRCFRKILRSLPEKFRPKVITIEECKNLENMKVEEFEGLFICMSCLYLNQRLRFWHWKLLGKRQVTSLIMNPWGWGWGNIMLAKGSRKFIWTKTIEVNPSSKSYKKRFEKKFRRIWIQKILSI